MAARRIEEYADIIGRHEVDTTLELAERVKGSKVIHVNSTSHGGGVAEILKSLIPLYDSVGLKPSWQVMRVDERFTRVTKKIHNALQGKMDLSLTDDDVRTYLEVNEENARLLDMEGDIVFIHDPQPLPIILYNEGEVMVWRCHIDMSNPNVNVWLKVRGFVEKYRALIFSMEKYVPRDVRGIPIYISPPSIDPLSEKNRAISPSEVERSVRRFGIDPERPIIGYVGRFDPWKDPLGALDVYRMVKRKIPEAQLVMIGVFADDDPEGAEWYDKTVRRAEGLEDVHILTDRDGVLDREVNAFQRSFSVALHTALREGFGLVITEALWKCVPVVARRTGGVPLQVLDGVTGYLVDSLEEAAERVSMLIKRPWLARELGYNGREHIRRNFLITRDLKDYLRIHIDLA